MISNKIFRVGLSAVLFAYQCILDINREPLMYVYENVENTYLPYIGFQLLGKSGVFILLFMMHRAFLHGVIIRIFTGNNQLLKYYVIIDLAIMLIATILFSLDRIILEDAFIISYFGGVVFKLLNTPILLLFFLPSYYLLDWSTSPTKTIQ